MLGNVGIKRAHKAIVELRNDSKNLQLIDEEDGPRLTFAVQNHFKALAMREGRTRRSSVHHQSLVTMSRR